MFYPEDLDQGILSIAVLHTRTYHSSFRATSAFPRYKIVLAATKSSALSKQTLSYLLLRNLCLDVQWP